MGRRKATDNVSSAIALLLLDVFNAAAASRDAELVLKRALVAARNGGASWQLLGISAGTNAQTIVGRVKAARRDVETADVPEGLRTEAAVDESGVEITPEDPDYGTQGVSEPLTQQEAVALQAEAQLKGELPAPVNPAAQIKALVSQAMANGATGPEDMAEINARAKAIAAGELQFDEPDESLHTPCDCTCPGKCPGCTPDCPACVKKSKPAAKPKATYGDDVERAIASAISDSLSRYGPPLPIDEATLRELAPE